MKIKDLKKIIKKEYSNKLKPLCVELVWSGFLRYDKLTEENYAYWWYETGGEIDKKAFTFLFDDISHTKKTDYIKLFIDYFDDDEPVNRLISPLLDIIASIEDRGGEYERTIDLHFGNRIKNARSNISN